MHDKTEIDARPTGLTQSLDDAIRVILAPNPSPMTFTGTNTYLLGTTDLVVIDPGPQDATHLNAILQAVQPGQKITHILVTHSHLDHSPLARALADVTSAKIYAYGASGSGRSQIMQDLIDSGFPIAGEGIDSSFTPDVCLADGEILRGTDWQITAHWTPGHLGNHMCFQFNSALFTGDLVMGWASSLVSPPDGDLTDFMESCRKLETIRVDTYFPGHGEPITAPKERLEWLISHRLMREQQILQALTQGPASARHLAQIIYTDTQERLMPAATRNVLSHLIDLYRKKKVSPLSELSAESQFQLKFNTEFRN